MTAARAAHVRFRRRFVFRSQIRLTEWSDLAISQGEKAMSLRADTPRSPASDLTVRSVGSAALATVRPVGYDALMNHARSSVLLLAIAACAAPAAAAAPAPSTAASDFSLLEADAVVTSPSGAAFKVSKGW